MARTKTLNKYDLSGEYGIGYFTDGTPFFFDKEDYDKIKDFHWCKGTNCGVANIRNKGQGTILRVLHRVILFGDKYERSKGNYSFKNGNRYDCRKENLIKYISKVRNKKSEENSN